MKQKNIPYGQTKRLYFRKIELGDFDEISKMLNQKSVREIWEKEFKNRDVKRWIENCMGSYSNTGEGFYIIQHKETNEIIGQISLSQDTINGEIVYETGYILNEKYTGQGYATEAAEHMCKIAFELMNLEKVIFEIRPINIKSIKVAKRLGAKETGSFIKNVDGKALEHKIYTLKNPHKNNKTNNTMRKKRSDET